VLGACIECIGGLVHEDITNMVQDDVQQHVNTLTMGSLDEVLKVVPCAKAGINVEEVLYGVAMVCVERSNLLEYWTNPQRRNAHSLQIAQLGGSAFEGTSDPILTCFQPLFLAVVVSEGAVAVVGLESGGRGIVVF